MGIVEWFSQLHKQAKPDDRQLLPLFFMTMPEELSILLKEWFEQTAGIELPPQVTEEVLVSVLSWTIFGTGFQWSDGIRIVSAEEVANQVTTLLITGFSLPG